LRRKLQKIALYSCSFVRVPGMPQQVQMIIHNNESVYDNTLFLYQEPETIDNEVFVFIRAQQFFPFKDGSSEKLQLIFSEYSHLQILRWLRILSVH